MKHQMYDRDIYAIWTNSGLDGIPKLHIEYAGPVEETLFTKEDLIALLNLLENNCKVPPVGWVCSREEGHSGACAARPSGEVE